MARMRLEPDEQEEKASTNVEGAVDEVKADVADLRRGGYGATCFFGGLTLSSICE